MLSLGRVKTLLLMLLLLVMGVGEIFAQSAGDVVMFNNVGNSGTMTAYPNDPASLPGPNETYPCKLTTTNTTDLYQYWEIEDAGSGYFYIKSIGRMANGNEKCYLVQYKYEDTDANKDNWSTTFAAASDLATLGNRAKFTLTSTGGSDGSVYIHVISQANGKYLGRNGGNTEKKDNIYADKGNGNDSKWQMVKIIPEIAYDAATGMVSVIYTGCGTVHYTTNGDDPTSESTEYSEPFSVSNGTVVKAVAIVSGINVSPVITTTIVSAPTIELDPNSFTYDGTAKEPSVTVKYGETTIAPNEYIISYSDNTNAGVVTVTITDNVFGDYCVVGSTTFTISTKSIGSGGDPATGFSILVTDNHDGTYRSRVKDGSATLTMGTDYNVSVSGSEGSKTATITGIGNYSGTAIVSVRDISYQYVALHASAKGYLKRHNDNGILANDATFRYGNSFENNNGSSIWVLSSDGHLTSDYYYLNVSNERKLYLSVTPITTWETEDISGAAIDGATKQHVYVTIGGTKYYLCNDSGIELKESPTNYYNACPITLTETSLTSTAGNLTVRSPQLISYLRNCYFTQKMSYRFYNDAGTEVKDDNKDRRLFVNLKYKSGGDGKGTKWDVSTNGDILYNKQASGDVEFTATYTLLAADPIVQENHPDGEDKEVKIKVQPKQFTPDTSKSYLIFSVNGGDNYRYPYDDGTLVAGSAVKPDGKGGTGTNSVLTDPDNDGGNKQISWKIEVDEMGFYTFRNVHSNRYLRFDEESYASDQYGYGTLCVGGTTIPSGDAANDYKFRLWEANNGDYGKCYYIIPWCRQFAWWKSDGLMSSDYVHPALNINKYTGKATKVISLHKDLNNSQWCLYKYEAEYRVRNDFTLSGPVSTNETGNNEFKVDDGWYGKYIKESPKNGKGQKGLVINGTYNSTNMMDYFWTVTGLNDYISISDASTDDVNGTKSITINSAKTLTINVTRLPVSSVSGIVEVQLRGGAQDGGTTNPFQLSDKKYVVFTIYGGGTVSLTEIASLSQITDINGAYKLTADVTYSDSEKPAVVTFSGILDCDGHTISGLSAPLFTTLTNGTVRNLNLTGVNISQGGSVGAIAGTANGASRIYNIGILSGNVGSTDGNCGGLVGTLDGYSRVINCFSFADVSGGIVGGIVGYNSYASTSNDIRTMVMNCMYYGNISGGTSRSPIYGGTKITNDGNLNGYNYYLYDDEVPYTKKKSDEGGITDYNCALAAEKDYLTRFEFFRYTLNSNRELAAWYATGDPNDGKGKNCEMAKWVQDGTAAYPILKRQGYYRSFINYDDAPVRGSISLSYSGVTPKTGAPTSLTVYDKDLAKKHFNYHTVRLPYYCEVADDNYTGGVVTGWEITGMTGGTQGHFVTGVVDYSGTTPGTNVYPPYNFADRYCTDKDLFSVSGRVFSQGAYFDVPEGVSGITIKPHKATNVAYLADPTYDVSYPSGYGQTNAVFVNAMGTRSAPSEINGATVHTTFSDALTALGSAPGSVYDNAIVLVGNYHHYWGQTSPTDAATKSFTIMSADFNNDCEPDYSFICQHGTNRQYISPIRFDFINSPGLGMVQKVETDNAVPKHGIWYPKGWFEVTNTTLIQFTQFEYDAGGKNAGSPLILLGGIYDQIVTSRDKNGVSTQYIHLGSNIYMPMFSPGIHTASTNRTRHCPVSVTGGEFGSFYLTGMFRPDATVNPDNAECYINGGKFGEMAGAGQEQLQGDVTWLIDHADIENFYGGGINGENEITGHIFVEINNSNVGTYCGGPKFGNMHDEKTVTTNAKGSTFTEFFGAGYGGTSYNRKYTQDKSNAMDYSWDSWVTSDYPRNYSSTNKGIATEYEYEFIPLSGGQSGTQSGFNVGRFYNKWASLSKAQTKNVITTLTDCNITTSFFGGGNLGRVDGTITTILKGCHVGEDVFGGGFSATAPKVKVFKLGAKMSPIPSYNATVGIINQGKYPTGDDVVEYTWANEGSSGSPFTDTTDGKHYIWTDQDLNSLGEVVGAISLTIEDSDARSSQISGSVYGGGDASKSLNNTTVTLKGNTTVGGDVFGGGNKGLVSGSATVNIED